MDMDPWFWKTLAGTRPGLESMHRVHRPAMQTSSFQDTKRDALILLGWQGTMWVEGRSYPVKPGSFVWIPIHHRRKFTTERSGWHRVLNFKPQTPHEIRMFPAKPGSLLLNPLFDQALAAFPSTPSRAENIAWEILWRIFDLNQAASDHPKAGHLVQEATRMMEWGLSGKIQFRDLARHLGVTHAHFTRTFHRETGVPPAAWLRNRRMALAKSLLTGTNLPIGEVGRSCGIPDAQAFNKVVRRAFGFSPVDLRRKVSIADV